MGQLALAENWTAASVAAANRVEEWREQLIAGRTADIHSETGNPAIGVCQLTVLTLLYLN